jgi:hypothetical protein
VLRGRGFRLFSSSLSRPRGKIFPVRDAFGCVLNGEMPGQRLQGWGLVVTRTPARRVVFRPGRFGCRQISRQDVSVRLGIRAEKVSC